MFGDDVVGDGTHDVDAEAVVFGVLESRGDEFLGEAAAAESFGDFGVPESHPALAIGFEFEEAGLALLDDFEAAAGDLSWILHARFLGFMIAPRRENGRGRPSLIAKLSGWLPVFTDSCEVLQDTDPHVRPRNANFHNRLGN
jgi:hypothetical protein